MSAYYVIPGSWRHLRDDYAHELHLQREAWRLRRWLWRAAYLREREAAHEARLAAQLRRYREWLEEAVPYLEQHLATHGERLAEEIEAGLAGTPASPEPFPDRARWLDAAADRVAAGEPVEQVMADFGWVRVANGGGGL